MPPRNIMTGGRRSGFASTNIGRIPVTAASAAPPFWVSQGATYDLDFANQRFWGTELASMTYTRALATYGAWSNGTLQLFASGVPIVTDLGVTLWNANQNLLLQSGFAATWTATRSTLTANAATAPTNTSIAATLIEDSTATSTHFDAQSITKAASALPYVLSFYAKSNGRTRIALQLDDNASNGIIAGFDLSGGQVAYGPTSVGTPFTSATTRIEALGSTGWYRCALIATTNTATTLVSTVFLDSGSGTGAQSTSYSGGGSLGATLFGAQLEQTSIGTASPQIPTTTVAVTRPADNLILTSLSFGTTYSILMIGTPQAPTTLATQQELGTFDDNSTTNRLIFRRTASTGTATLAMISSSATQYNDAISSLAQGSQAKLGMAIKPGTQICAANGTTASHSIASGSFPAISQLNVGAPQTSTAAWCGQIARIIIWPQYMGNIGNLTL